MLGKIKCTLGYHDYRAEIVFQGGNEFINKLTCKRCGVQAEEKTQWTATKNFR